MNNTSKVYVLPDERGRILRCEGGYTMGNIEDISQWVLIDEGTGDKYNLCQSNYFPKPLYEEHGIPVYKLDELDKPVERTAKEIAADVAEINKLATPMASRNITVGEYITVNGVLYKAISNIPNGGAIITGQNAVETTIEEQLYELTKGE